MSDAPTIRERKFIRNALLSRKQVRLMLLIHLPRIHLPCFYLWYLTANHPTKRINLWRCFWYATL